VVLGVLSPYPKVAAYNYTCALTRYRLTTITGGSIVDAAHIHQLSDSRNNDPRNGLALCKNAHWLFDNGLWTLTDDYRVIVAEGRFAEDRPEEKQLQREFHGQKIHLPDNPAHWAVIVIADSIFWNSVDFRVLGR
jgi:putative restriction endonuclease